MKYIYVLISFVVLSNPGSAEEILYRSDLQYKYYNDVWKSQNNKNISLRIEPQNKRIDIYVEEILHVGVIQLDDENRKKLIDSILKYNAWNNQATKKRVKIDKQITEIKPIRYYFKSGNDWYETWGWPFTVQFFSQSSKIHQLVFLFPNVPSTSNDYIKHQINTMYFTYQQANSLRKALLNESIDKFMAKYKEKKSIEDEFK
ncbi:MAG: hypothetical protein OEZ68_22255 [Gammaproteobacteria bacterium]|nr:hypothetical protein [Gammaproteobacteria bacterium]MDH5803511.1 hypothetical protein [Gammaproteobacteria bacterium]